MEEDEIIDDASILADVCDRCIKDIMRIND